MILELRHIECEPPGSYAPVLDKFAPVRTVRLWTEPVPDDPTDFAAIIVMGGPMGAGDGAEVPWIDREISFLRRAVDADVPVWGVCLGAQLLAAALGARVRTGPAPEVGMVDVTFTGAADPVWPDLDVLPVLQWHSDTFDLPAGATLLASSTAYPQQLFRYGRSYGVQFHLEADVALAQQWLAVPEYRSALESTIGAGAVPDFMEAIAASEDSAADLAQAVILRWLQIAVG
ncbi:glutamine amidotransferase [Mycobacterium sp. MS1601]|uniref:type 1 glutamine amidotransferase n=1 Tax=Mycobacterium sp. MS1601 TaxID=1936029 RepID=UPI000979682F|nr:type 1 glutamine amidotransferase [Mycobacterium sp. MS1601]AQA05773.1 glutamine amidotransferase [Mycobacterium sp. MS1601]